MLSRGSNRFRIFKKRGEKYIILLTQNGQKMTDRTNMITTISVFSFQYQQSFSHIFINCLSHFRSCSTLKAQVHSFTFIGNFRNSNVNPDAIDWIQLGFFVELHVSLHLHASPLSSQGPCQHSEYLQTFVCTTSQDGHMYC